MSFSRAVFLGSLSEKGFLCALLEIIRVSLVKLSRKTLTTALVRSHKGTRSIFPTDLDEGEMSDLRARN